MLSFIDVRSIIGFSIFASSLSHKLEFLQHILGSMCTRPDGKTTHLSVDRGTKHNKNLDSYPTESMNVFNDKVVLKKESDMTVIDKMDFHLRTSQRK